MFFRGFTSSVQCTETERREKWRKSRLLSLTKWLGSHTGQDVIVYVLRMCCCNINANEELSCVLEPLFYCLELEASPWLKQTKYPRLGSSAHHAHSVWVWSASSLNSGTAKFLLPFSLHSPVTKLVLYKCCHLRAIKYHELDFLKWMLDWALDFCASLNQFRT